jgi:cytochrome c556
MRAPLLGAAALLGLALGALTLPALAQDPIEARKANRTAVRDDFRWINQQQNAGDLNAIAQRAGAMLQRSQAFLALFPPGSDRGNTGALPVVWTDWPGFQAAEATLETRVRALQAAAAAGDRAAVQAAVRTTGAACQACHDKYRRPTT